MAIDARIPLMGQSPDIAGSLQKGLNVGQTLQDMKLQPKRNQLLDLQMQNQQYQNQSLEQDARLKKAQADFMPILQTASRIKSMGGATPQNAQQIARLVTQSGAPQESVQQSMSLLQQGMQTGDFNPFNAELDNALNAGLQMGLVNAPKAKYSNIRTTKDGRAIGMNQQGNYEVIPTPEDVELSGSGTTINLNNKALSKEQEALATSRVKRYEELWEKADNAIDQDEQLAQLENINTQTGFGMQARGAMAAAINGIFGEGEGDELLGVDVDAIQAYNSLSNRMVNSELNKAKGPQTEGDAQRARDTVASLTNEQEANQFIINSLRATNARKIEQAEFHQKILERDGTLKEADKEWLAYKRKTPMLSSLVKNASTGLPMFFNEFKQQAQASNPNISDELIVSMWRDLDSGMSPAQVQAKYSQGN